MSINEKQDEPVKYQFGTLWWAREAFICKHFPGWIDNKRLCHPLLSTQEGYTQGLFDVVPMLAGRTAKKGEKGKLLISVQDDRKTEFGNSPKSQFIYVRDFLDIPVINTSNSSTAKQKRYLWPNRNKKQISSEEYDKLKKFLNEQKNKAIY